MDIGVTIPNHRGVAADDLVQIGIAAEEMGFDSLWASDHLLNDSYIEERMGDAPYLSPLACLAYLAGATRSIRLGTSVLTLPLYAPVQLAKYVASLDQLSHGRVILAVGAGALASEYDASGLNFLQRGRLLDESLEILTRVWSEPRVTMTSSRTSMVNALVTPKPFQSPVALWIGGWSDAALRRAALWGSGWHSSGQSLDELRTGIARINEHAKAAGRDHVRRVMSVRVHVDFGENLGPMSKAKDIVMSHDIESATDRLRAYEAVGVTHVVFALESASPDKLRATMERMARRVIPTAAKL